MTRAAGTMSAARGFTYARLRLRTPLRCGAEVGLQGRQCVCKDRVEVEARGRRQSREDLGVVTHGLDVVRDLGLVVRNIRDGLHVEGYLPVDHVAGELLDERRIDVGLEVRLSLIHISEPTRLGM